MERIAKIITFIFHPIVLVSPSVFFIIYISGSSLNESIIWTLTSMGFLLAIAAYIRVGMKAGFFSNFDVSKREQRVFLFPAILVAGLLFLTALLFFRGPLSLLYALVYFILSVAVLALVTLRIKASIHVGGITAAVVSIIYFFGDKYIFLLFIIPVMAWARIIEKRHTLKETLVGFLLGLLLALLGIFGVQYLLP